MPRRLLKFLKACWTALAWLLFLTGVIGCGSGGRATAGNAFDATTEVASPAPDARDAAPEVASPTVDAATETTDAATESAPDAAPDAARLVFQSYLEVLTFHDFSSGTTKVGFTLSIDSSGAVNTGHATPAELAAFAEIATRPETIAAFADHSPCSAIGDGGDDLSLTFADGPTYMRSSTCTGVGTLAAAAKDLSDAVSARVRAAAADGGTDGRADATSN